MSPFKNLSQSVYELVSH